MTVTSDPRRAYTEPSSRPMTPAPMTASVLGTLFNSNAPVDVTTTFSSTSTPFRAEGSEPVAITMFLAVCLSLPTVTSPFAVILPQPLM